MSPFAKALAMQRRLVAAIDRHGLPRVIEMIRVAVLRRGLMGAVQLGAIPRPFSHRLGPLKSEAAPRDAPARGPPSDLDADYMIAAAQWGPWLELLTTPVDGEGVGAPAATFVVAGDASAARDATLAAARAIGGDILAADASIARPELGSADAERFLVFLEAGDIPSPRLPQALAHAARGGLAEAVSFDLWRREGERVQPLLAPGANPTLLQATDYLFSRVALRGSVLPAAPVAAPFAPRDWMLAWLKTLPAAQARGRWRHIGAPLVEAAVSAGDIQARREDALAAGRRPLGRPPAEPVSVVLCTKDKGHLTRQLVRRLLDLDPALLAEVAIVSNNTTNPYAVQALADLQAGSPRVQVLKRDEPFNFSKLSNAGARACRSRGPLLFLNDDIAPVSEDWLRRLEARLQDPDVGAVGPLLLYPDERVQHAGMYVGRLGTAGHTLRAAGLPQNDYLFTAVAPREVSSLTGAVLLTPRPVFEALNGFDEQLATHLQDVDYCLRVRASGLVNVFEPAAILIHMESASVGGLLTNATFLRGRPAERERFMERWAHVLARDPLHAAEYDLEDETLRRLAGQGGRRPKA